MKKLKLNLDEIKVESFETEPIQSKMGTVLGNLKEGETQPPENCNGGGGFGSGDTLCYTDAPTCPVTCQITCPNTCQVTCPNTCAWSCWDCPTKYC